MTWPHYKTMITVDDAVATGACRDGVMDWYLQHGHNKTALPTAVIAKQRNGQRQRILIAAHGDGYGGYGYDGYGYDDGDGDGDGGGDGDDGDGGGYGDGDDGGGYGDGDI